MSSSRRKESVISDVTRTADELPSIIVKLTNSSNLWTSKEVVYPFSRVLRLRVLQDPYTLMSSSFYQPPRTDYMLSICLIVGESVRIIVGKIVCGISMLIMGAVGCIEERGNLTNLALGVPAGLVTVIAAGASIHTSRGFGGYRASSWSEGSILRALGPTPQTAAPLVLLWISACCLHGALLVQSTLVVRATRLYSDSSTRFQLAIVELILSTLTLVAAIEVLRIDLTHDPD